MNNSDFHSLKQPKQRILYLSQDSTLDEKLAEVLDQNFQVTILRSLVPCEQILQKGEVDVFIVDERIFQKEERDQERRVALIFEYYKVAHARNTSLLFIVLVDKVYFSFKSCPQTGASALFIEKEEFHPNQVVFLIKVLRKRYFRTILGRDLVLGQAYHADLYHYMPMNNKYALFLPMGETYRGPKQEALKKSHIHHLYVKSDELLNLFDQDGSAHSKFSFSEKLHNIRKRYRSFIAQFFGVFPGEEYAENGKKLYEQGVGIVRDLMNLVGRFGSFQQALEELPFPRFGGISHGLNCTIYFLIFSEALDLAFDQQQMGFCSLVHNLGLSQMPKELIEHEEIELTPRAKLQYEKHPLTTLKMLERKGVPLSVLMRDTILHHHENADGTGFPNGQSGNALSINASLLSLVGSFDHLRTVRPEEKHMDLKEAFFKLLQHHQHGTPLGQKFHPLLIEKLRDFFGAF